MSTAVLSIGSNLGDRMQYLRIAVDELRPFLVAISPVFETPPWGPVEQPPYLNAVLLVADETAPPRRWLALAQDAEVRAGRVRDVRWGPRTLDVDVVSVDDVSSDEPEFTLPHPRAAERAFVLVPWLAVDRSATVPGVGSVADLLAKLPPEEVDEVRPRTDLVLE